MKQYLKIATLSVAILGLTACNIIDSKHMRDYPRVCCSDNLVPVESPETSGIVPDPTFDANKAPMVSRSDVVGTWKLKVNTGVCQLMLSETKVGTRMRASTRACSSVLDVLNNVKSWDLQSPAIDQGLDSRLRLFDGAGKLIIVLELMNPSMMSAGHYHRPMILQFEGVFKTGTHILMYQ